jgi:hypothetical protein
MAFVLMKTEPREMRLRHQIGQPLKSVERRRQFPMVLVREPRSDLLLPQLAMLLLLGQFGIQNSLTRAKVDAPDLASGALVTVAIGP